MRTVTLTPEAYLNILRAIGEQWVTNSRPAYEYYVTTPTAEDMLRCAQRYAIR